MPTQDGTASARERELNRKAAADSRRRKKINARSTELLVDTLYAALSRVVSQVQQAATSDDPRAAVLSLAESLPSPDSLDDKSRLL